jgi:hypothetical protein
MRRLTPHGAGPESDVVGRLEKSLAGSGKDLRNLLPLSYLALLRGKIQERSHLSCGGWFHQSRAPGL